MMMDPTNLSPADGLDVIHQNGVHDEPSNAREDGGVSNDLDPSVTDTTETVTPNGNLENFNQVDSIATDKSSMAEIKGSNNDMDDNNMTIPKEEVKITDQTKQSRAQKGPVKDKNAKAPSSGGAHASSVTRSKTGKDKEASSSVSNGTLASDSRSRQSIKSRSFNEQKTQPKRPLMSDAASSVVSMEKTKPKSVKKGPLDKVQGETESFLRTNAEDTKSERLGTLPNYGFSFRCGERAERRKEFYNKLEEKIQAKEVEKSNMQAKTKENQEAEIKKLRKSLTFKATPMPGFYQEPPPPKVELKKMPTTRAKSPKLGRKKSSTNSESDGNSSSSSRLARLSLDEKASQSNSTKGTTTVPQKKPQRRSLPPRLASERNSSSNPTTASTSSKAIKDEKSSLSTKKDTNLSNATTGEEKTGMIAVNEEKSTLSNDTSDAMPLNVVPSNKPSDAEESHVNGDIAIEENNQFTLPQEPIAAEQ